MDHPTGEHGIGQDSHLQNYKLGKKLGIGSFSKVIMAQHVLTGHKVAIKILNRKMIKNMGVEEKVQREVKILRLFMHPHVIRLYEIIKTQSDIYVVMEYAKSGELLDHIIEKGRLDEGLARRFFQQIISGVEYCHRNMVVHRDLKPENLLLDPKYNIKIPDFGLSNVMRDGRFLRTSCGSPNYPAPEVVSGKLYAGPEVDVWSCGVILYALLCGALPFDDENIPNLFKKIKNGVYTLPSHLSVGARDVILRMLNVDPMRRITIPEIHKHPWFQAQMPRYLKVPPPDSKQQANKIDEDILAELVGMGFDRNQLIDSLLKRIQDEDSATLHRHHISSASTNYIQEIESGQQFPLKRKWVLGLQSRARPHEIMAEVLKAFGDLNVCWKKIGHYNMKCRWFPDQTTLFHARDRFGDGDITESSLAATSSIIKFEIQLYKATEEKYLLDLQRVGGPHLLFLDLCAAYLARLGVL